MRVSRKALLGLQRCRDNIFLERLWRTINYKNFFLHSFENDLALRPRLAEWILRQFRLKGKIKGFSE